MHVSAATCQLRIAIQALEQDRPALLRWAVVDALRVRMGPSAIADLWHHAATSGSTECIDILREHARLTCTLERCHCRTSNAENNAAHGWINEKCPIVRVACHAARERRYAVVAFLCKTDRINTTRCLRAIGGCCIKEGRPDVIDAILGGAIGQPMAHSMKLLFDLNVREWTVAAACCNQASALEWIAGKGGGRLLFSGALVYAATYGSIGAIDWLCKHRHLVSYVEALLAAIIHNRQTALETLLLYKSMANNQYRLAGRSMLQAAHNLERDMQRPVPLRHYSLLYRSLE